MKQALRIGIVGTLTLAPFAAFAQSFYTGNGLLTALVNIRTLVQTATPIVTGLAILAFFWGLAIYLFNAGNEKKKKEGRNIMIWGVIALFVMFSIFGIIAVLQQTLNVQGDTHLYTGGVSSPTVNGQ